MGCECHLRGCGTFPLGALDLTPFGSSLERQGTVIIILGVENLS